MLFYFFFFWEPKNRIFAPLYPGELGDAILDLISYSSFSKEGTERYSHTSNVSFGVENYVVAFFYLHVRSSYGLYALLMLLIHALDKSNYLAPRTMINKEVSHVPKKEYANHLIYLSLTMLQVAHNVFEDGMKRFMNESTYILEWVLSISDIQKLWTVS